MLDIDADENGYFSAVEMLDLIDLVNFGTWDGSG